VEVPSTLNLSIRSKFKPQSTTASDDMTGSPKDREEKVIEVEYDLYSVIMHSGSSLEFGHYYGFFRDWSDAFDSDVSWYRISDESVYSVSNSTVSTFLTSHYNASTDLPYLLFYRRKNTDCAAVQEARDLIQGM